MSLLNKTFTELIHEELARPNVSAVRIMDQLLRHAHSLRASDIHFYPTEHKLLVRFRIDGTLSDAYQLPLKPYREMLTRLKVLANLRIDEQHLPQDGRFRFDITKNSFIDIRVSISATYYGENAVLRLFSSGSELTTLNSLGFDSAQGLVVENCLSFRHGLVLISGSTGSGKTATLYALLQYLRRSEISIVSIEDPIEYSLPGITQIQVHPALDLTFSTTLRSVLRQDPDVIGIGEIRDKETASSATQAALTGHLVISTLHASNASSTIPRLLDLGIEPYMIASTLRLVISQRLAKKLCPSCRTEIAFATSYSTKRHIAAGCEDCNFKGTKGRIGIFEILPVENAFRDAITQKVTDRELYAHARAAGMIPLEEDARSKVLCGLISSEEALALSYA